MAMLRVTIVKSGRINIFPATPRALNAPVDLPTKPKVPRHAMRCLLDRTVGTVKYVNVKRVITAPAKPQTKPLARPDPTPPTKDPLHALNAHPERMPTLLVLYLAKIVNVIPTNPNPMLRNAFQCKKGSTNRVPQHK